MREIILASASPARAVLLQKLGLPFSIDAVHIDESALANEKAPELVMRLAYIKAAACLKKHPQALCIGADTLALLGERILGKPKDAQEARRMLQLLSGQQHYMMTGLCLVQDNKIECVVEQTAVTFRCLKPQEIDMYVSGGGWQGHAAGYALQDGNNLLAKIDRSRSNVIGLPLSLLRQKLTAWGIKCADIINKKEKNVA